MYPLEKMQLSRFEKKIRFERQSRIAILRKSARLKELREEYMAERSRLSQQSVDSQVRLLKLNAIILKLTSDIRSNKKEYDLLISREDRHMAFRKRYTKRPKVNEISQTEKNKSYLLKDKLKFPDI